MILMIEKLYLNSNPKWKTYEQYDIYLKEIIKENSNNIEDNNNNEEYLKNLIEIEHEENFNNNISKNNIIVNISVNDDDSDNKLIDNLSDNDKKNNIDDENKYIISNLEII